MVCILSHFFRFREASISEQAINPHNLLIFYQNVRGLRTKCSTFYNNILSENYPIVVITETWLNSSFSNSEIIDDRYVIYRRDRDLQTSSKERGGGVLIAVLRSLLSYELLLPNIGVEEVWVVIRVADFKLLLCAVYIPPSSDGVVYSNHLERVEKMVDNSEHETICLIGDYNLPSIEWVQHSHNDEIAATKCDGEIEAYFCDLLSFLNLSQHNCIHNHNNVILDLVLCNYDNVEVVRTEPLVPLDSNHPPMLITLHNTCFSILEEQTRYQYQFHKAPYNLINDILSKIDWNFLYSSDIDICVDQFYTVLHDIITEYVPRKRISKSSFPKWISVETQKLIYRKKEAHRNYKASLSTDDYVSFTTLRHDVKEQLEKDKIRFVKYAEDNIVNNSQFFWRYVNSLRNDSAVPNCMIYNDELATGGGEVSDSFARFFGSNYASDHDCRLVENFVSEFFNKIPFRPTSTLSHVDISYQLVLDSLLLLKPKNSCGPDKIAAYFVYHCAISLVKPLCMIFQRCLSEGVYPNMWRCSNVFPIHKSGSKSDISNYRPVCLNSNFAKVFDFILSKLITEHVRDVIIAEQHGFSSGKSTETNLFVFTNFIYKCIEDGSSVDCVYTDLSKAFDKVPINLLLFKLKNMYGIQDPLLSCLEAYLSNRTQQVTICGYTSNAISVPSGVGQGTHLGPILFTLFINDVKFALCHCKFLLFADDCKLFKCIKTSSDQLALQTDINNFYNWCKLNSLSVNIDKCKHLQFTRKSDPPHFAYILDGILLESVSFIKDLGIFVDKKLSFNQHIGSIIARANKLLGFLSRTTKMFNNIRSLIILYLSIVRPIIEYCCVIWAPSYVTHIRRLEKIQRKFVKLLCFRNGTIFDDFSYEYHLQYFSLPHLITRRKYFDIMFAYKVINSIVNCSEIFDMFVFHVPIHTLRINRIFEIDYHRTNYGKHSPLVRVCNHVNDVNVDLFSDGLLSFKRNLRSLLF